MPINTINYKNTIIYKIVCNNLEIKDVYVGHTTNFTNRKRHHKEDCYRFNSKKSSYKVYQTIRENGGWDNWSMIEIEKYPCKDNNEARARERFWYEQLNCTLNSRKPICSKKEYTETHKTEKQNYDKIYREVNKEKIKERKRKEMLCECGLTILKDCYNRHSSTRTHLLLLIVNKREAIK